MANKRIFIGTGRRKSSVAQVKMVPGKGKITINGVDVKDYFPYETNVMDLKQPLVATNTEETFDIEAKVNGGGFSGQAGAVRLGITRDPRAKERKKPGLKAARRAPQFSKR